MSFQLSSLKQTISENKYVHELFEAQVERTPEAVALVFEDQRLTYRELNALANQLARYLQKLGAGPEVLVGLCAERSLEMMIGLLGILKAGSAYLPLNPTYPQERLSFVLMDAGVTVLLTQERLKQLFAASHARLVCLDTEWNQIASQSKEALHARLEPENATYVIYTSGSTGKPKGVVIPHSGLANYLNWCVEAYGVTGGSGSLVYSSISFDLTITGLFAPLLKGKTVTLTSETSGVDELARFLSEQVDYGVIKITPAHLRVLSELLTFDQIVGRVNALVIGGEALHFEDLFLWRNHGSGTRMFNEYGPTETVVGCCVYEVCETDPDKGNVPIGRPVANTQLFVLDETLKVKASGEVGELYIGGAGVARCYLNRPELTAQKFIPNPFGNIPGSRLYKTGDLVRYLPDGNLEYKGRIDNQIKLRGFRIELGEVETVLAQHENVRDCVVEVRENERSEKLLVAYVVPTTEKQVAVEELRRFLKRQLPDFMVPSTFVNLDRLALTSNGKIDRGRLPEPSHALERGENHVAPRNYLEVGLRDIWEKLLLVRPIGVTDDFFELGGDSISGVRLFARIEERLGKKLPLAVLFETSTIEGLSTVLQGNGSSTSWSSLVPIHPKGSKPPLFCVHACGAHVFIYRTLVSHLSPDQPVFGLQARGLDGKQEPYNSVEDMAAHYVGEIRGLQPHGPYYLVGDTLGGLIALEMALQLSDQREAVGLLAMFDTFCPLPLSPSRRLLSHLSHFRESGLKAYLRAGSESMRRRLMKTIAQRPSEIPLTEAEQSYATQLLTADDPLSRIEWAIYQAVEINYVPPKKSFPGKLTYFLARDNQYRSRLEDTRLNWKKIAAEFEVHVIPGRHDTMREEPHVAFLAERLTDCLDRAMARHATTTQKTADNSESSRNASAEVQAIPPSQNEKARVATASTMFPGDKAR